MRLSTARLVTLGGVVIVLPAAAIAAENAPNELAPITVQEQPVSEAQKERAGLQRELALTPGGVTLVEAEDLEERNVATLGDMLRYVPGMWTADGSTGDGTFLSSRGSNLDSVNYDGNGVKLMIDGLPVTAADGNNHNSFIDPLAARYAVIARGA
ncbi:MAG: Plug domain-containing protein, partial [Pseudomonadales bacterium]|nr:Plug domain-containing protein [Pseudomonadales bacterium]